MLTSVPEITADVIRHVIIHWEAISVLAGKATELGLMNARVKVH